MSMDKNGKIPLSILCRAMFRSFLLQASWNYEGLQNIGFLFVMAPALRWLYAGDDLERAFARHLEKFNTHPYLAGPILGVSLALEEKNRAGEEGLVGTERFKEVTMSPYGAMGDSFFWGALRPLAAVVSLYFALRGSLLAPLVFLLLFNLPHLWCRVLWFWQGYREGLSMVQVIERWQLPDLAVRLKEVTVVLLGGISAYLVFRLTRWEEIVPVWGFLTVPLVCGGVFLVRKGVSPLSLLAITTLMVFLSVGL